MLVLTNVLPLIGALALLAWLIDQLGTTDWGRLLAVAAACFATFLTTFAVTLNNHSTAAICSDGRDGRRRADFSRRVPRLVAICSRRDSSFGFLAANELPALSLLVFAGIGLAWKSAAAKRFSLFCRPRCSSPPRQSAQTMLAHGDWQTPYAHRGPVDNWYDYPGSYWLPANLRGIDVGEPSPLIYAFNVLIGHHGLFSLTPIWLLSAIGCAMWLRDLASGRHKPPGNAVLAKHVIAVSTAIITLVVITFYLTRPQIDRNYGGGTCCLRWLIWLTPLWLLTLLPAADWLGNRRWGRGLSIAMLIVSVFSAAYGASNPWSHPWIFDYWTSIGWISYQ